ncbi:MAG: IS5 family transposase, partial [Gammaproteobacteria bacterium]|nr:IS5 family transposase [Gammaproteobacteria bacterium]
MKPKLSPREAKQTQREFFQTTQPLLSDFIDMKHPLVKMADSLQWDQFDQYWQSQFSTAGGPKANSARRVAGMLMLKHMDKLSDEALVAAWVSNPYYQYFCGETHFQHRIPVDPATLGRWRKRIGEEGFEWLISDVLGSALRIGAVQPESLAHVCVDSTVMEKNITHPTDSKLWEALRLKIVGFMRGHRLSIRRSYNERGPRMAQQIARYAHARQFKRMRKLLKEQRTMIMRLVRELQRQWHTLNPLAKTNGYCLIDQADRLRLPNRREKLYSLHEPKVDCISKGKAHKRYEFGTKVSVATTQTEGFVVGIRSYGQNPYDGHTLDDQLQQVETISGTAVKTVAVDLGYRSKHHLTTADVIHRGRKLDAEQKQRLRRRNAIEAIIGHMKQDDWLGRCYLKGPRGDAINALLCGIGQNLRFLRNYWLRRLFAWIFASCREILSPKRQNFV